MLKNFYDFFKNLEKFERFQPGLFWQTIILVGWIIFYDYEPFINLDRGVTQSSIVITQARGGNQNQDKKNDNIKAKNKDQDAVIDKVKSNSKAGFYD